MRQVIIGILIASSLAFAGQTEIAINKMTCGGCVSAIKNKLCKVPGVKSCEVEVGKATLDLEPGVKMTDLHKAIEAAGYEVATGKEPATPAKKAPTKKN